MDLTPPFKGPILAVPAVTSRGGIPPSQAALRPPQSYRAQLPRAHPAFLCCSLMLSEAPASHLTHFRTEERPSSQLIQGRNGACNWITRPATMAQFSVIGILSVSEVTTEALSGCRDLPSSHGTSLKGPKSSLAEELPQQPHWTRPPVIWHIKAMGHTESIKGSAC